MRRLLAAPGFLLRLALGVALLGGVVFFALTRTMVGREGLRRSLEAAFAQQFDGTLTLDTLAGDLVGTLDARGVTIRDARGDTVLTARRLLARPTLRALVTRDLELREITLSDPRLTLHRDTAGVWNVARLLRPTPNATRPAGPRWRVGAPVVRVVEGRIDVSSAAPDPPAVASGTLADVFNARYENVSGQATVEWVEARRVLLIERLRFRAPALALAVEDLSGQYREERQGGRPVERVLAGLRLRAGGTRLQGELRLPVDGPVTGEARGTVDFAALHALLPRLPLRGQAQLALAGTATASQVTLSRLDVRTGASRLRTKARLAFGPDSLLLSAEGLSGSVRSADLRTLLPDVPAQALRLVGTGATLRLDRLHLALDRTNARRYGLSAAGAVQLPAGRAEGRAAFVAGRDVRWDLDLAARTLDLDALTGQNLRRTRLTGRLAAAGRAPSLDAAFLRTAETRFRIALGPGMAYGRALDSLLLDGTLRGGLADTRFALRQGASRARGGFRSSLIDADAPFRVQATLQSFDVGALLASDTLRTRLTGTIEADLRGRTLDGAAGTLALRLTDALVQHRAQRLNLPALTATVTRDAQGEGHLVAQAAAFEADLTGTLQVAPWRALFEAYSPRLAARYQSAFGHRRGHPAEVALPPVAGAPKARLRGTLTTRDPAALLDLGVDLPVAGSVRIALDAGGDGDGLRLDLDATADTLRLPGRRRVAGLHLSTRVRDDGRAAPDLTLSARADSLLGVPLLGPPMTLDLAVTGDAGTLALRTRPPGGRYDGAALRLAFLPDRLRLTVDSVVVGTESYRFAARTGLLDLYADAAVVQGVSLEADAPGARQVLSMSGNVSASPGDTLYLRAAGVSLATLLGTQPPQRRLGGRLDGDVALSALLGTPDATGEVRLTAFTLGRHALGDARVRSFYRPGDPDVTLDVRLAPGAVPPGFIATENRIHARGAFRLPGGGQPAALDVQVEADRAEAFFFDYLFADLISGTSGVIQASVRVQGDPRRPQFSGTYNLQNGRLNVPRFGLLYTVNGEGRLEGDDLLLDRVVATDGTGGEARVGGAIRFNDYRFLSLDLQATLDDARVLDVPTSNDLAFYGRLWASGDLRLTGPVDAAVLQTSGAVVSPRSEVFIPIRETFSATDPGFIVRADSAGRLPDLNTITTRTSLFTRPVAERSFDAGLTMDLSFTAPSGSRLNLVFDPLRGDVMRARGAGDLRLVLREGEFSLFGALDVEGGDYLFTASDLFARQFRLDGGTLTWDGDPIDPRLQVDASYRTRASLTGLAEADGLTTGTIPLVVRLELRDRLQTPAITLALALDRSARADPSPAVQTLETLLNAPERRTEYATSVLLTNSFLLTTSLAQSTQSVGGAGNQLAFTSVSELVSAQLNRYLSAVVPGLELRLGVEGERTNELDVTYGVALRLLDERLIIRGEGVLAQNRANAASQGLQGEFVVEVRLSPAVSVEVFYRREDDALQQVAATATSTTGASLAYQARFASWRQVLDRLLGRGRAPAEAAPAPDSLRAF